MTSVPNHPQPLNGSRLVAISLLTLLLGACVTSSISTRDKSPVILEPGKSTDVNRTNENVEKVDTVEWTLVSESEFPPITSSALDEDIMAPVVKEVYDMALLIPFRASQDISTGNLDPNELKFAHFYAGLKLAVDKYGNRDVNVQIRTFDTQRSTANFDRIIDRIEAYGPDLIVGPYETGNLSRTAEYAKSNRIPVISPWRASTRITEKNPFYLQIRPNITEYYRKMIRHINYNFDRSKVRILARDTGEDDGMVRAIQEINEEESPTPIVQPLLPYYLNAEFLMVPDSLVFEEAYLDGASVFLAPHFSAKDERFLYSSLRKIYGEKGDRETVVYTMPLALNSERIDLNLLKNLDLRICEYKFPDNRKPEIQSFRQDYFDKTGWLPTDDSYFGYDLMKFIIYGLEKHGQYFHYFLSGETVDLSQMSLYIEPFYREKEHDDMDYLMNSHLYIIEYRDDHFDIRAID